MAGRSAVVIFFVLSGFVLAYSLKLQPLSFGRFAIKRFFWWNLSGIRLRSYFRELFVAFDSGHQKRPRHAVFDGRNH